MEKKGQYNFKRSGLLTPLSVLPPAVQPRFNYPNNNKSSPLFGAQPSTQQLLLFEAFGPAKPDPATPAASLPFPPAATGPLPQQDGS